MSVKVWLASSPLPVTTSCLLAFHSIFETRAVLGTEKPIDEALMDAVGKVLREMAYSLTANLAADAIDSSSLNRALRV